MAGDDRAHLTQSHRVVWQASIQNLGPPSIVVETADLRLRGKLYFRHGAQDGCIDEGDQHKT